MREEELVQLGLSREQADGVRKIYAEEVKCASEDLLRQKTELARVQGELEAAGEKLAQYQRMDLEGLQSEVSAWKEKARMAEENGKMQEEKRLVRERADKLYQENGARSGHVIDALVDWEQVKVKEGRVEGLDGQIAEIKRQYVYLFEPDVPPPQFSVGLGDAPAADESRAVREAMGL